MGQVVGDSPFLKRVLIPFWVIRILIMVIDIGLYGVAIGVITAYADDVERVYKDYGVNYTVGTIIAIMAVIVAIVLFCLILDIVCIIKRARRTLSPRFFLIVNVIQTTIWTVQFVLAMIGARTAVTVGIGVIV
jgi:hypothetical protein